MYLVDTEVNYYVHNGEIYHSFFVIMFYIYINASQYDNTLRLPYFPVPNSAIFVRCTLVLSFYIGVVLTLSILSISLNMHVTLNYSNITVGRRCFLLLLDMSPPSHLYNRNPYTGKAVSLYWIGPQDWKNARVSPIYKDDGNVNDENNYRPISVIGHIAKMVESLMSYQIIEFLESHSCISMDQSAYLKRHSTQTCLHRVIDDWLEHINDGEITGACLLDIFKCLDSINHILLLKKLEMYGIIGTELDWFSSYLNGRKQFVKFNNETSESCEITCGVPQGSVLGPILFLLFINDISNFAVEGCVLNMYADDVIIYTSAMSTHELECKLQSCIDSISNWYDMNNLCINKKKSSVMIIGSRFQLRSLNLDDFAISVNADKLQLVEKAKYLGLWVRNDLSWDDHILELCRKMYYYVHMFRRLRKILPSQLLLNIYKSYVQSKIDYG